VAALEQIEVEPGAMALIARHATGSFRDALGTLEQLVTYAGDDPIVAADVLAVLGVADAEQLFEALDAVIAHDPAQALRSAARLASSGRDPGQVLRDLEIHARELLAVRILQEVPDELRITPERDQRLLEQAGAIAGTDVVRLLDLVASALEATANGAQARIQLELVLVKAAAPEVDPSTAALLARIERLEDALRAGAQLPGPAPREGPVVAPTAGPPDAPVTAPIRAAPPAAVAPPEPEIRRESHQPDPPPVTEAARNGPSAQPVVVPAPSIGEPELDTLAASWPAVIDIVRQDNAMLAAALDAARPVGLSGGGLTLAFPSGAAFFKRKAEQDDHRRAATDAVRSVTGAVLTLRYELRDEAAEPIAEEAPRLSGEELVKRFMEEFDAEEVLDDPDQEEAP
jgi:DNA polymerase-3 subunit gamma/tau